MVYVVKGMIKKNKVWDTRTNSFIEVAPYLHNPCGGSYAYIIRGLKTVRGVKNQIKNYIWPKDVVEVHICSSVNPTSDDCDKLIERLYQGQFKN